VVELYTFLSPLPRLEVLDLSYNSLSVVTNNVTGNVNPDLRVLDLANSELTVFPEFLRAMKNLEVLDLAGNNIHGLIPDWAGEVGGNKLVYLDLSDNSITGLSLFQCSGLKHLYLQSNMIQGLFPLSICDMNNLNYLDISNNSFGGIVPQCLGNSRFLVSLNVNFNNIRGLFPTTICNITHLKYLDMSRNSFYGVIPQCLGYSRILVSLNVNSNMIRGPFPTTICDMTHLSI
ncbi:leucine-rich repeat-containing protein, partial [Tanacetum coccineum]